MAHQLVIVESPAKSRSIQKYLGSDYKVIASMGHIMDLPKKGGVTIEGKGRKKVFTSTVEPIKAKDKVIREIRAAAKKAAGVFLATDPDREGEVIAHHVAEVIREGAKSTPAIRRVLFHEITPAAVRAAFHEPRDIDVHLVESQQARRILDRIVGFDVSQLLWEKVARGLSAGRVQTVALKIIVDREREIRRFVPVESWSIAAQLRKGGQAFEAQLVEVEGKKVALANEAAAQRVLGKLAGLPLVVGEVTKSERRRNPLPPFITSTLQQEAARRLNLPVSITMRLAQKLYEGVDLADEGPTGLITYMRTDSVRVADSAIEEARSYIGSGRSKLKECLPEQPNRYRTNKAAQDAHEAIRPTSVLRTPNSVKKYLDAKSLALYTLIWRRFVASQCLPAIYDTVSAEIDAGPCRFRANGSTLKFQGFLKVYADVETEDKLAGDEDGGGGALPSLEKGDRPELLGYLPRQHFTQPPPRFSEAALVKALEEKGIGRPSTYASIIATLKDRQYTHIERRRLIPTDLGMSVTDLLVAAFPDIFNLEFTVEMEKELDDVEEGNIGMQDVLNNFHVEFEKDMKSAAKEMPNLKIGVETDHSCETCGAKMLLRYGRMGRFFACSRYPDCTATYEVEEGADGTLHKVVPPSFDEKCPRCGGTTAFKRSRFGAFLACTKYPECRGVVPLKKLEDGGWEVEPVQKVDRPCPTCGGAMEVKRSRFGRFFACEKYPDCKGALPYLINVRCPNEGCEGELAERQARKGVMYTCTKYPECKFRSYDEPLARECPECKAPSLFRTKDGELKCARESCPSRKK